jgi:pilus assembly protein TadC
MRANKVLIFLLMMMVILPVGALAQPTSGSGILGGMEGSIFKTIENVLNYPMPVTGANMWKVGYNEKGLPAQSEFYLQSLLSFSAYSGLDPSSYLHSRKMRTGQ